jgi:hypothetical protein
MIDVPGDRKAEHRASRPVDVARFKGTQVLVEADVKAENVGRPATRWNGIKMQLHFTRATGEQVWANQEDQYGTFTWRKQRLLAWVPADVQSAELLLGLEGSTGRVWFDNITLRVYRSPPDTFLPRHMPPPPDLPRMQIGRAHV